MGMKMKRQLGFLIALGTVGMLTAPNVDACVYNLNTGTANSAIGTSVTIAGTATAGTTCGSSVTLAANGPGSPQLFNKQAGAGETGLGLTNDSSGDNEVTPGSFIQIDLNSVTNPTIGLSAAGNSVQSGESWEIFGSNTSGTIGTTVLHGPDTSMNEVTFTNPTNFRFLDFTAASGNGLLNALDSFDTPVTGAPEPASLAILGASLLGFGLLRRRRKS
jgi:hypothetical protein